MSEALRKKFETEIENADWAMLKEHHQRGALFLVDEPLDFIDVAIALAEDNLENVKKWQGARSLRSASDIEISEWEKDPYEFILKFVIVQPFIIATKIKETLCLQ